MTRNELVLAALAGGEASTASIARLTGLSERVCRYRFRWLITEGSFRPRQRELVRMVDVAARGDESAVRGGPDGTRRGAPLDRAADAPAQEDVAARDMLGRGTASTGP